MSEPDRQVVRLAVARVLRSQRIESGGVVRSSEWLVTKLADALKQRTYAVLKWVELGMPYRSEEWPGTVYFVQPEDEPFVKIGYTVDLQKRIRKLQTANHLRLHVRLALPGTFAEEGRLHEILCADRKHLEWFNVRNRTLDILDYAARLRALIPTPPSPHGFLDSPAGKFLQE